MKKVFGIISYFPDDPSIRIKRQLRLEKLLSQLNAYWPDVPVFIVAQNWKDTQVKYIHQHIKIFSYPKLGILGARKELRRLFLDSYIDYLIMLDDDIEIKTSFPVAKQYMEEIDKHPNGFCFLKYKDTQLSLCAISRYIYLKEDMPDLDPEKGEGFEDDVFSHNLHFKYPDKEFSAPKGIECLGFMNRNAPSTWWNDAKSYYSQMHANTVNLVKKAEEENKNKASTSIVTLGTFDLLHYGHIRLLKRAKEYGSYLYVGLSTNEFAAAKKKKVYYDYNIRKEMLESLTYVDEVFPCSSFEEEIEEIIKRKPDIFIIGDDYAGEFDCLQEYGITVIYLPRTPEISTSKIKKFFNKIFKCGD